MAAQEKSEFERVYSINVNGYTEKKKNGSTLLTYLSWSNAWAEFKKIYPEAQYEIEKNEQGNCFFGNEDIGYMCYTRVTANGITYEMWLPVMDSHNRAMKLKPYDIKTRNSTIHVDAISMFDINKTLMRCFTKNLAMFGLGLYIYNGEDLPEDCTKYACDVCGTPFEDFTDSKKKTWTAGQVYHLNESSCKKAGITDKVMCKKCREKYIAEHQPKPAEQPQNQEVL